MLDPGGSAWVSTGLCRGACLGCLCPRVPGVMGLEAGSGKAAQALSSWPVFPLFLLQSRSFRGGGGALEG